MATYEVVIEKIDCSKKTICFDQSFNERVIVEADTVQEARKIAMHSVSQKKNVPEHLLWTESTAKQITAVKKNFYPRPCKVFSPDSLALDFGGCANILRNAKFLENASLCFERYDGTSWTEVTVTKEEYETKLGMKLIAAFNVQDGQVCVMSRL